MFNDRVSSATRPKDVPAGAVARKLTVAFRKAVVSISALIAIQALVLGFARALAASHLTHVSLGAVDVARAGETERVIIVALVTPEIQRRYS